MCNSEPSPFGVRYSDDEVIDLFSQYDCTVHSIEHEIVTSGTRRRSYRRVTYTASCGHSNTIRLGKFLAGQGRKCEVCRRPRGERHPAYNPNLTDEQRVLNRDTVQNTEWRKAVYERDNYTCQICGDATGGNLEAHHLNSYTDFPDERYVLENGVTLCTSCHFAFHHAYSYHHNTKAQFEEWLRHDNTEVITGIKEPVTP